jgi:hypothetical protein
MLEQAYPTVVARLPDATLARLWPWLEDRHDPNLALRFARHALGQETATADRAQKADMTQQAIEALTMAGAAGLSISPGLVDLAATQLGPHLAVVSHERHFVEALARSPIGRAILARTIETLGGQDLTVFAGLVDVVGTSGLVDLGVDTVLDALRIAAECLEVDATAAHDRAWLLHVASELHRSRDEQVESRVAVDGAWRRVLQASLDDAPAWIMQALTDRADRRRQVDLAYTVILERSRPDDVRQFLRDLDGLPSAHVPARLRFGQTFLRLLAEAGIPVAKKLEPSSAGYSERRTQLLAAYNTINRAASRADRPHIADMVHAILRSPLMTVTDRASQAAENDVRSLCIQALCAALRFDEAGSLSREDPAQPIGTQGVLAPAYVADLATKSGESPRSLRYSSYEHDYRTLVLRRAW